MAARKKKTTKRKKPAMQWHPYNPFAEREGCKCPFRLGCSHPHPQPYRFVCRKCRWAQQQDGSWILLTENDITVMEWIA